jgi:hypothetical protein
MAAQTLPPTKVLTSRTVSLDEAHSFLTNFISTSDAIHLALAQDLGLNDQRRIAQALEGIYIPKPVEEPPKVVGPEEDTEMGGVEAGAEEQVEWEVTAAADITVHDAQEDETKVIDKEKRKAEKKARRKAEQQERKEQLARVKAA